MRIEPANLIRACIILYSSYATALTADSFAFRSKLIWLTSRCGCLPYPPNPSRRPDPGQGYVAPLNGSQATTCMFAQVCLMLRAIPLANERERKLLLSQARLMRFPTSPTRSPHSYEPEGVPRDSQSSSCTDLARIEGWSSVSITSSPTLVQFRV